MEKFKLLLSGGPRRARPWVGERGEALGAGRVREECAGEVR